jgi:hypothetical protein
VKLLIRKRCLSCRKLGAIPDGAYQKRMPKHPFLTTCELAQSHILLVGKRCLNCRKLAAMVDGGYQKRTPKRPIFDDLPESANQLKLLI